MEFLDSILEFLSREWTHLFFVALFNMMILIHMGTMVEKIRRNNMEMKEMEEKHMKKLLGVIDQCTHMCQVDRVEELLIEFGYRTGKDGNLYKPKWAYIVKFFKDIVEFVKNKIVGGKDERE